MKKTNNKQGGFSGIIVILVVLLLLGTGLFYVVRSGMFFRPGLVNNTQERSKEPEPARTVFSYTVKSITPDTIVLVKDKIDFELPNDPQRVSVFKGLTKKSATMPLSELKVGDVLNMEFIPGQSASLFVKQ